MIMWVSRSVTNTEGCISLILYFYLLHGKPFRYHLSQFPHPSWVYDHNELAYYVHYITKKLSKFYAKGINIFSILFNYLNRLFLENIPQDPVVLSYWFAQNFQLAHSERLDLLKCNSVLERFRMEQRFLHLVSKMNLYLYQINFIVAETVINLWKMFCWNC